MKQFKLVHILTMLSFVVVLASCGLTQPGYGEEEYSDRPVRSRQVYMDPYYGNTTIVRDPYTGRYYEVTPVSPYGYDTYSSPYGSTGNSRYYEKNNARAYTNNTGGGSKSSEVQHPQRRGEGAQKIN